MTGGPYNYKDYKELNEVCGLITTDVTSATFRFMSLDNLFSNDGGHYPINHNMNDAVSVWISC